MSQDSATIHFPSEEEKILDFWQKNDIFKQSEKQTAQGQPYIFYDGPPFATGLPHHGHLLASTLKDIIPRYYTMQGRHVIRRFGWDCHGLPIEYEIDKSLGMNAHDAVAKLGVAGYNNECRAIVQRYTSEWEKTISRLGRWVDFEDDYKTMDCSFMESVWWVFNQLWEKDLIYQGTKVVPFSTALGTGLSNFEAGSNYQDVQDPAITVLFQLKDSEHAIAAWTTTPWTLPSNLALCVGDEIEYSLVKDETLNTTFYIATARLEAYSQKHKLEVIDTCYGRDLVGLHYQPLFDYFQEEQAFVIVSDAYVTTTDGTGIVHCAPAFGEDDARVLQEAGIKASVCPVNDQGCFTEEVYDFAGISIHEANKGIIGKLKTESRLYQHDTIVHSYPFCPRSDTPLIYKAVPSWYVNVERIKDRLIKNNEAIHWVPGHIQSGRFGKWLENAKDWAVSRSRIWGTPLPIWINDETGKAVCFGDKASLEKASGVTLDDLHREHVDPLTFTLDGETGTYRRIEHVLDCWFESGSMPYAQLHYPFENKDLFENGFPAEFIAEGLDQTRGWFYTLHVLATALFDKPAFTNVIVNGIVMAEDGKKMSKRLKNYTAPDTLMDTYGADALRLYLIQSGLVKGEEQRFSDEGVKDMVRRTLLPWYNAFSFYRTYVKIDGWQPTDKSLAPNHWLDRWIISRLNSTLQQIETHMQAYQLNLVVPPLLDFIEDLTNGYIRLNRQRFWAEGMAQDKSEAYATLHHILTSLTTMMAPFTPFLSETLFQALKTLHPKQTEITSVHLCPYPAAKTHDSDSKLEQAVNAMQQIILLGRQKRNDVKIKVKTPLSTLTVIHQDQTLLDTIQVLEPIIKKELNVKQVCYDSRESEYVTLSAKPNSPVLGKRFGKAFAGVRASIESLDSKTLRQFEQDEQLSIDGEVFSLSDILLFRHCKEEDMTVTNRTITITLNTELNEDLIQEGYAREIINRIQKTRKNLQFNVDDRIQLYYTASKHLEAAIQNHQEMIQKETLCVEIQPLSKSMETFEFTIEGETITLALKQC